MIVLSHAATFELFSLSHGSYYNYHKANLTSFFDGGWTLCVWLEMLNSSSILGSERLRERERVREKLRFTLSIHICNFKTLFWSLIFAWDVSDKVWYRLKVKTFFSCFAQGPIRRSIVMDHFIPQTSQITKLYFDFCNQPLKRLLHPSIRPSIPTHSPIHPVPFCIDCICLFKFAFFQTSLARFPVNCKFTALFDQSTVAFLIPQVHDYKSTPCPAKLMMVKLNS